PPRDRAGTESRPRSRHRASAGRYGTPPARLDVDQRLTRPGVGHQNRLHAHWRTLCARHHTPDLVNHVPLRVAHPERATPISFSVIWRSRAVLEVDWSAGRRRYRLRPL